MALAFYFAPTSRMTAQQYDEITRRLAQAGAGRPKDRLYHARFGTPDSISVFDVWTSQAAFDTFRSDAHSDRAGDGPRYRAAGRDAGS